MGGQRFQILGGKKDLLCRSGFLRGNVFIIWRDAITNRSLETLGSVWLGWKICTDRCLEKKIPISFLVLHYLRNSKIQYERSTLRATLTLFCFCQSLHTQFKIWLPRFSVMISGTHLQITYIYLENIVSKSRVNMAGEKGRTPLH